jgi:hypothetical protein
MKKNGIVILLVILLGAIAYYSFTTKNSTLSGNKSEFRIQDPNLITRMTITEAGKESRLEKIDGNWFINDEPANLSRVNDAIKILTLLDAVSPVSGQQNDSIESLFEEGLQIRIYKRESNVASFRLCKKDYNIYAKRLKSKQSFRITVKGYGNLDLLTVFSSNPAEWSQNLLIDYSASELKEITIKYPEKDTLNFSLIIPGNNHILLLNNDSLPVKKVNFGAVQEYLSFFTSVRFVTLSDTQVKNSKIGKSSQPFFVMKIVDHADKILIITGLEKTDLLTGKPDPYEFIGFNREKGFMLLKYNDFDPLLVSLDYFLKK